MTGLLPVQLARWGAVPELVAQIPFVNWALLSVDYVCPGKEVSKAESNASSSLL